MSNFPVIWRPNEHADEYIVYIEDAEEWNKWKEDKSVAMALFVAQFSIFKSSTSGHTGTLGEISKQEIENVFFGNDKNVKDKSPEAAIRLILEHGEMQKGGSLAHGFKITKNAARGAGDTRGTGAHQGTHR